MTEDKNEELNTQIDKARAVMRALCYSIVMKRVVERGNKLSIFKTVFVSIHLRS